MGSKQILAFRIHKRLLSSFRTSEGSPLNHDQSHLGKIYTVPKNLVQTHFQGSEAKQTDRYQIHSYGANHFLPFELMDKSRILNEHSILVRHSALEIFHYLNQYTNSEKNVHSNRKLNILINGEHGTGKSSTLGHVAHYALDSSLVLLNFYNFKFWLVDDDGLAHSSWKTGRIDNISKSVSILQNFISLNSRKIENCHTHREYNWTNREKTENGSPLADIVMKGIERPKFAADALNVLMRELQISANEGLIKLIVMGDGINCIFNDLTSFHREKLVTIRIHRNLNREFLCFPNELSVIYNLKKLLKVNCPNVIVVATVDSRETVKLRSVERKIHRIKEPNVEPVNPFDLLGEQGWKGIGPYIPVKTEPYTKIELTTILKFLSEKKFISDKCLTKSGIQELFFLTGGNPLDLSVYSNTL